MENKINFLKACRNGDVGQVKEFFSNSFLFDPVSFDTNLGMANACFSGSQPLVEFLIDKGEHNFDGGMIFACLGGHENIVN